MPTPLRNGSFALLAAFLAAAPGCSDDGGPAASRDASADTMHNVDALTVKGKVTLTSGSAATGVTVTARCGAKSATAKSNDKGEYTLTADVRGCTPLVVEFDKESYLPNFRVIHIPSPTSPITLDVPLTALSKLQCGSYNCTVENSLLWNLPNDPMKQGWVTSQAGSDGLDYIPGELRQTNGNMLSIMGFSFFDFRDQSGKAIAKLDAAKQFEACVPIPHASLDWIGDVTPTTDALELGWYDLDKTAGRWKPRSKLASVAYTKGYKYTKDAQGNCVQVVDKSGMPVRNVVRATRKELADIRADQLYYKDECLSGMQSQVTEFWVCGLIDGSGWYAWGLGVTQRTCFALTVTDQCKKPLRNVVFTVKGRDHGYRAEAWTDGSGEACLDVIPSEPQGKDFDLDTLGGETYWVDVVLSWDKVLTDTTKSHQNPLESTAAAAGCAKTSACTPLSKTLQDWNQTSCQ